MVMNELRGLVLTRFRSISEFARELNWDRKKASRIVNRVQDPTVADMEQMAAALKVLDPTVFCRVFLPNLFYKVEKRIREAQ